MLKLFVSGLLLGMLIAAESLAVMHSADHDTHANGEPCKICISVAGFAAALPAKTELAPPPDPAAHEQALPGIVRALARAERRRPRGPPLVS